jgi:hypothetical protein
VNSTCCLSRRTRGKKTVPFCCGAFIAWGPGHVNRYKHPRCRSEPELAHAFHLMWRPYLWEVPPIAVAIGRLRSFASILERPRKTAPMGPLVFGAPDRIRTCGPRIRNLGTSALDAARTLRFRRSQLLLRLIQFSAIETHEIAGSTFIAKLLSRFKSNRLQTGGSILTTVPAHSTEN